MNVRNSMVTQSGPANLSVIMRISVVERCLLSRVPLYNTCSIRLTWNTPAQLLTTLDITRSTKVVLLTFHALLYLHKIFFLKVKCRGH